MPVLIAPVVILQIIFGGGPVAALMIVCRIVSLVMIFSLLVMTTETREIALGITGFGFNYKTAFIITSALNILPVFREDAGQLLDARRLRGVMPPRGKINVFAVFGEYSKIAVPLMIKAMRRASATGLAMDSRAFGAYRRRTWPRKTSMSAVDYAVIAAGIAYAAAVITANYMVK